MNNIIKHFHDILIKLRLKKELSNASYPTKVYDIPVNEITPKLCYSEVSDSTWLTLLLNPNILELPSFPQEETQLRFTGLAGLSTMKQAFEFYNIIKKKCLILSKPISSMNAILDFGCGWGRILRIFLRDIEPNKLYGSDCTEEMISLCKDTNRWCNFSLNNIDPPTNYESSTFDLIYAYSVFSHLSEKSHKAWLEEFYRILRPNGILIVTTRQKDFINQLAKPPYPPELSMHINKALQDYDNGSFVYFGTGGGFGLTADFYGEAFIPKTYVEKEWSNLFAIKYFIEGASHIDQNIIIVQKRQ